MKELVCIVCPRGCTMKIEEKDGAYQVSGNFCKRGEKFAKTEMTEPMRPICTTVRTSFEDIPKNKIFDVMKKINETTVTERISRGDKVIENVLGLGVDVIATSDILKS